MLSPDNELYPELPDLESISNKLLDDAVYAVIRGTLGAIAIGEKIAGFLHRHERLQTAVMAPPLVMMIIVAGVADALATASLKI